MAYKYKREPDRFLGHDYPGVCSNHFVRFEIDELELGGRVAVTIDDPEQWWWELIGNKLAMDSE